MAQGCQPIVHVRDKRPESKHESLQSFEQHATYEDEDVLDEEERDGVFVHSEDSQIYPDIAEGESSDGEFVTLTEN